MINLIRLAIINFFTVIILVAIVGPKLQPQQPEEKLANLILSPPIDTVVNTIVPTLRPTLKPEQKSSVAGVSISLTPTLKSPTSGQTQPINTTSSTPTIAIPQTTTISTPTQTPPTPTSPPNLASQVPSHNQSSDCWVIYNSGVYNITGYFGHHPGGDSVMAQVCGRDITAVFNAVPHSSKAKQVLETYRIH